MPANAQIRQLQAKLTRALSSLEEGENPFISARDAEARRFMCTNYEPERKEQPKFLVHLDPLNKETLCLYAFYGPKIYHPDCTWIDETYVGAKGKAGIPVLANISRFPNSFLAKHLVTLLRLCNYPLPREGLPDTASPLVLLHLKNLLATKNKFLPSKGNKDVESLADRITHLLSNPAVPVDLFYLMHEKLTFPHGADLPKVLCVIPDEFFPSSLFWTARKDRVHAMACYPQLDIEPLRITVDSFRYPQLDIEPFRGEVKEALTIIAYSEALTEYFLIPDDPGYARIEDGLFMEEWTNERFKLSLSNFEAGEDPNEFSLFFQGNPQAPVRLTKKNLRNDTHGIEGLTLDDYKQILFYCKYFFRSEALASKYSRMTDGMEE